MTKNDNLKSVLYKMKMYYLSSTLQTFRSDVMGSGSNLDGSDSIGFRALSIINNGVDLLFKTLSDIELSKLEKACAIQLQGESQRDATDLQGSVDYIKFVINSLENERNSRPNGSGYARHISICITELESTLYRLERLVKP